jgi:NAD(P)-dependent dehydrogenase (short-subunit alcohol dehydrogenase family)
LARRLHGSTVTANCLHPGFVASAFGNNNGGWLRFAIELAKRTMAISQTDGAKTSIYLASSPDVAQVSGKYFDKCAEAKSSSISHEVEIAKELWKRSEELSGLTFK